MLMSEIGPELTDIEKKIKRLMSRIDFDMAEPWHSTQGTKKRIRNKLNALLAILDI